MRLFLFFHLIIADLSPADAMVDLILNKYRGNLDQWVLLFLSAD